MRNPFCLRQQAERATKQARSLRPTFRRWRNVGLAMTGIVYLHSCSILLALEIPPAPTGRVSDYAGMLSVDARTRLEELLRQFETETSNQVVVATFPSLEGEVLEDFSIRLAEAWKIGQKDKDNGVILVIFKEDRAVRIEVGYGLEGVLPDATCKLIIENEISPRFREGKFDEGIENAIAAIVSATKGEYQSQSSSAEEILPYVLATFSGALAGLTFPYALLIFLFVLGILAFLFGVAVESKSFSLYGVLLGILPVTVAFFAKRFFRDILAIEIDSKGSSSGRGPHRSTEGFRGGGFGGGFGGGGFSGGGGGFGGGGASGGW